jgi:hypothetical protein
MGEVVNSIYYPITPNILLLIASYDAEICAALTGSAT